MFCLHEWETIEEWREPSLASRFSKFSGKVPLDVFYDRYCIKQRCKKCGKERLEITKL